MWIEREVDAAACAALRGAGHSALLARLMAARGIGQAEQADLALRHVLPPTSLMGIEPAARLLGQAVLQGQHMVVVADYDCDGATACAVAIRGLRSLGAQRLGHVVPDRRRDGYGLTADIARRVHDLGAEVLITVDNGIASVQGVQTARELGLKVLITDHHLPGPELPRADALVNPNQPGCGFASKHVAGVGVMFYVLLATRAWLRDQGHFSAGSVPTMDELLPLVALGTVADVVVLDDNNRRLVHQGLQRMRKGRMPAGMAALFEVAGRDPMRATAQDLGFALAPRINAAGRMAHMDMGIECLLTDDPAQALPWAQALDRVNTERKAVEDGMQEQVMDWVQTQLHGEVMQRPALSVFHPQFHEGVIGIVAGRLKDQHHRPTFVFAPAHGQPGWLKGSGRSIAGFHLRDALDAISKMQPEVLTQFGGHAMAAGCTLKADRLAAFELAFTELAGRWIDPQDLNRTWVTDGDLDDDHWTVEQIEELDQQIWGAGFAAPLFCSEWKVMQQRLVGDKHLKLKLARGRLQLEGIWFGRTQALPSQARLVYRPSINRWRGQPEIQVQVQALVEAAGS
jgi:single-stranded-DNA-specific exonuclease